MRFVNTTPLDIRNAALAWPCFAAQEVANGRYDARAENLPDVYPFKFCVMCVLRFDKHTQVLTRASRPKWYFAGGVFTGVNGAMRQLDLADWEPNQRLAADSVRSMVMGDLGNPETEAIRESKNQVFAERELTPLEIARLEVTVVPEQAASWMGFRELAGL